MLAERWDPTSLGSAVDLITGFPFKSDSYADLPDDIRLLRGDNIVQGSLRWDGVKRWPKAEANDFEGFRLQKDDVVLAMDRPWIDAGLKYASITDQDLPCLLVQRVARLRGKRTLSTRFLKYLIGSPDFTMHVLSVQTGTAVPHISGNQIKEFRFLRPPLDEQNAIAEILGALDDKIDLNRRMNQTLEAMAHGIFKSWFVDFEPPPERRENYPTLISSKPGWAARPLDSIADFLNGLALQKYPSTDEGSLPTIKIADLRRGNTENSKKAGLNVPDDYVIEDGTVLFSWSGTLEVVVWTGGRGALNQHLFKVSSENYPKWFYLYWLKEHLPSFRTIAADKATTMGHIQRRHLTEALVAVPPAEILEAMDRKMAPLLDKQVQNNLESRTLASIRDALLPKLLSGEIRVKQAEKIMGEVV